MGSESHSFRKNERAEGLFCFYKKLCDEEPREIAVGDFAKADAFPDCKVLTAKTAEFIRETTKTLENSEKV